MGHLRKALEEETQKTAEAAKNEKNLKMVIENLRMAAKEYKDQLNKVTAENECLKSQHKLQKQAQEQLYKMVDCSMSNARLSQMASAQKPSAGLKTLLDGTI